MMGMGWYHLWQITHNTKRSFFLLGPKPEPERGRRLEGRLPLGSPVLAAALGWMGWDGMMDCSAEEEEHREYYIGRIGWSSTVSYSDVMFGWGSKKATPREIQIGQLKKVYPSAHETARGQDNVFDIGSRTHGGINYTIRIFLGKDFPAQKPVVLLYTPEGFTYRHPNVNSSTKEISGLDKLSSWGPHSSIVEVINDCLTLVRCLSCYYETMLSIVFRAVDLMFIVSTIPSRRHLLQAILQSMDSQAVIALIPVLIYQHHRDN